MNMKYQVKSLKRKLTTMLLDCKVYHRIILTDHFIERVIERDINVFKLSHILNFAIARYCFSIIYDKTFSFKYGNEFIVVGEFTGDAYLLKTVINPWMKAETEFSKILVPK